MARWKRCAAQFAAGVVLGCALWAPVHPAAAAEWGTFRGGPGLTGYAAVALGDRLARVWHFRAGAPVRAAPVAGGGRVYFHTVKGEIFALDRQGRKLWSAPLAAGADGEPLRAPLLYADGLVIAGSRDGSLRAFDADSGRERWHYRVGADVQASANRVDGNAGGVVVVSQPDGVLHLVSLSSGQARWRSAATNRCDGPAAVEAGLIAYGNCDAAFHVFDAATGRRLHQIPLGRDRQVFAGVALAGGRLYGGDRSGRLTCADTATGRMLWSSEAARKGIPLPPAVSSDRVVYGADDGRLYALDRASGRLLWSAEAGSAPVRPVVLRDRVVATAGGAILLLRLDDGRLLWSEEASDEVTEPVLAADLVLVGTEDGFVIAYGPVPAGRQSP